MSKYIPDPLRLFGALGHPTRTAVVQQLCRRPETVSRLAAPHRMALPSFVQHLRVLEDAGWIRTHKRGRVRTCEINADALQASAQWLLEQRALWEQRLDRHDAYLLTLHDGNHP